MRESPSRKRRSSSEEVIWVPNHHNSVWLVNGAIIEIGYQTGNLPKKHFHQQTSISPPESNTEAHSSAHPAHNQKREKSVLR